MGEIVNLFDIFRLYSKEVGIKGKYENLKMIYKMN